MSNGADLPDDVDALKAMLLEARASISQMQQDLAERDLEIEKLKAQIDKYKRMQFGSKSEKLGRVIEELETSLEDLSASRGGAEMQPLGEDVSEQLGRIMATFKVIRTIRRKKICTCCRRIVQPAAPSQPIQRGIAHSSLLADMLVGKYGDHLPLHRQSAIAARENVTLDTASMGRWVGMCEALLDPLVQVLQRYVMSGTKLHADDTPIPVLAPGHKKPGLPGFGSMCAMTADPGRWSRPLRGLGIRQVDEENTPNNICVTSKAFCGLMLTPDITRR
jgi:transposase